MLSTFYADASHAPSTVLNWQLSMDRHVQAIDLITNPRTWSYFRVQPRVERVGCIHTEDGSTSSSQAGQACPHLEVHFLGPSSQGMRTIDMR